MIILEGADGTGKSTLSKIIMSAFPQYKMIHSPGPMTEHTSKERLFWNIEMTKIKNVIADRISIVSEWVYGPILRGHSQFSDDDVEMFMWEMISGRNIFVMNRRKFIAQHDYTPTMNLDAEEKEILEHRVDAYGDEIRKRYDAFTSRFMRHEVPHIVIETEDNVATLLYMIRSIQNEH